MDLEDLPYGVILYRCTPEERKQEYSLATAQLEIINRMESSKEEKKILRELWLDYLCQYERLYNEANNQKNSWVKKDFS
jgi:hypothetical protein